MKKFHLTILGSNAASPAHGRITSCQILNYDDSLILIDCGEGCQIRLSQYKIKKSRLDIVCISHLHGDHVFGLPGLLGSLSLEGRSKKLKIFGPEGIEKFIQDNLENTSTYLSYDIEFIELNHLGFKQIEILPLKISAFPLKHRVQTYGYRFDESLGPKNIDKEAIKTYNLSIDEIKHLKNGNDITRKDGELITSDQVTLKQREARSYAYCSDTIYDEALIPYVSNVNYLYMETTYMHDLVDLAMERMHSTSKQTGKLAKKAGVEKLITGHYSGRYKTVNTLYEEAKLVFPNTIKGYDGLLLDLI